MYFLVRHFLDENDERRSAIACWGLEGKRKLGPIGFRSRKDALDYAAIVADPCGSLYGLEGPWNPERLSLVFAVEHFGEGQRWWRWLGNSQYALVERAK